MVQPSSKATFEFRDKLESWIEGIFDTISVYIRTVLLFNFRPFKTAKILKEEQPVNPAITQPGIFMIISYFIAALLIKDVDFSDPVFAFNLAKTLNALGALEAAKSLDVEKVLLGIFPAIGLLVFFCYVSGGILLLLREKFDPVMLRRRYCYLLGDSFLLIGIVCGGYSLLVKPLSTKSWWLGLPVHLLSMFPLVGVIMLALNPLPNDPETSRGSLSRFIARNLPWTILILLTWRFTGSWGLLDYLKAR